MPNPSWVNFVVSAKARSAIRHYLKSLRRTEAIALGQRLLNQSLGEFQLSVEEVTPETLQVAVGELGMKDLDELYERIGLGERLAPLVARRLLPAEAPERGAALPADAHEPGVAAVSAPLAVAGTEGLLVSYARCCFPIPYDPIFAFLSSGRGIVIHREDCVNVEDYRKHPEKWLPVSWQSSPDRSFTSQVRVDVQNRMGVLAAIASSIASTETNIDHVSVEERDVNTSAILFELKVRDRKHLARVIRTVRRMPDVLRVGRTIAARSSAKARKLTMVPVSKDGDGEATGTAEAEDLDEP
jgi:GTP diphosphokinase / guanosine-3',5'-bis(diphosphate) 3'-diphosphatase